jgi:hypothetical protein
MLKDLIGELAESLWPASIRDSKNIVKAVVASAIDVNGEEKFPQKWNESSVSW